MGNIINIIMTLSHCDVTLGHTAQLSAGLYHGVDQAEAPDDRDVLQVGDLAGGGGGGGGQGGGVARH